MPLKATYVASERKTITAAAISAPVAPVPTRYARKWMNRGGCAWVSVSVVIWSQEWHATPNLWAVPLSNRRLASELYRRASDRTLRQIAHRIHRLPVDAHFEVEMRAEAKAGAVADADHLPLADLLADRDGDRLLVGVAGGDPATVVEAGVVAVAGLRTRDRDGAGGGGLDRRAAR